MSSTRATQFGPMPKIQRVPASAGVDAILQAFYAEGAVVIEQVLPPRKVQEFNEELDGALAKTATGAQWSDPVIADLLGKNTKRLMNLPVHSRIFRHELIENELVHALCTGIFRGGSGALYDNGDGGYWINTAQIIDIGPGSKAQRLHRDQDQHAIWKTAGPGAPECQVNFFFALTDFTEANGATRIRPGSHTWPDMSTNEVDTTAAAEMRKGDVCLFSGKTIHGGGANITENEWRRALALNFCANYLVPEDAYAFIVPREIASDMTERGQRMIGFRSAFPEGTVGLWNAHLRNVATHMNLSARPPATTVAA